jgi:tetratricopeptide (TPR) repeat protein
VFYAGKALTADATKFYDRAIALNITDPYSYVAKGEFLAWNGQFQHAIEMSKAALELEAEDIGALKLLAASYFYLQDTAAALATYERIETINSAYIEHAQMERLRIALLKGDTELATSINPDSWDLHFFTGNEKEMKKIIQEIIQVLKMRKKYSQKSEYFRLRHHPAFQNFQSKAWFQQILADEKKKHDLFYSKYPRAVEILK